MQHSMAGRSAATAVLISILSVSEVAAVPPPGEPTKRTILQTIDVPGSSYQVVYARVEIAPNSHTAMHTHPGTAVGYLLEGDYSIHIEGRAPLTIAAGSITGVVPAGVPHEEIVGARGAKLLVVFTVEKGKPLSSPAK
jgi:quercetin dioxygenase-like cupin family protein